MAFSDPQSLTVDGTAVSLSRVYNPSTLGTFTSSETDFKLEVGPQNVRNARTRRSVALTNVKITADPLVSATNVRVSDTVRLVIDRPVSGYSDVEVEKQVLGLVAWLTANTNLNLKKLVAGEN